MNEEVKIHDLTEKRRSRVRRVITYSAIGVYLFLSILVVCWLLWKNKYDMAIAVLGGVGSMAGSITGFWFGARQIRKPEEGKETQ